MPPHPPHAATRRHTRHTPPHTPHAATPATPATPAQGDAEDLPFATDSFDRYVSAGSIEYWPEPQRGICEAYRVIKEGGVACMIGPVYPTFWLSRWAAAGRAARQGAPGVAVAWRSGALDGGGCRGQRSSSALAPIAGLCSAAPPPLPLPLLQVLRRRVDAVPQGGGVHRGGLGGGSWALGAGSGLGWSTCGG
jgi:SAM-dependent methyltransferase